MTLTGPGTGKSYYLKLNYMATNHSYDKKPASFVSPDLSKLQAVVIDVKTILYIALDADPKLAKSSYLARVGMKKL